jgi:hypothetical protein
MMNDCPNGEMRDLLPGYVRGTLSAADRSAVASHLETCADCVAEARLISSASQAFPVPAIDVGKIVRALPSAPRRSSRAWLTANAWRAAAAIGIVALGAYAVVAVRGRSGAGSQQAASGAAPVAAPAVASAPPKAAPATDAPARVVAPAASSVKAQGISFGGGLSDLTDAQLDALLGELNSLDSLPSAEPESHLTPIVPMADGGHHAR